MINNRISIIMAGGSGERFWPLSRVNRPKQLLRLTSPTETLVQQAVNRIAPLIPKENLYIATSVILQDTIQQALPDIPSGNILGEPCKRNTAGCLAYATAQILARFGEAAQEMVMSITTADHRIADEEKFRKTVDTAMQFAAEHDALVTIGIKTTRPETGYGYLEIAQLSQPAAEIQEKPIYKVARFLEKPTRKEAEQLHFSQFHFWNSGMFFWKISTFLKSLEKVQPQIVKHINQMAVLIKKGEQQQVDLLFEQLPDISIDYALMEKASNVYVVLSDFSWDDVGSWDAFERYNSRDDQGNISVGDPVLIDCENVTVYNDAGETMAVGVVGIKDAVVVTTPDGVLVCSKDKAMDVRKVVQQLKDRNAKQV
ncbi:MAG: mannose-1-phosphate guanylyltransferase [bacterium]|jgi:mannose-1-phosphate guanylyltransferase